MLVDLEMVKRHLRVDFADDDPLLAIYHGAAERSVVEYIDRQVLPATETPPAEGEDGYDPTTIVVNDAIIAAIFLTVSHLNEHRDSVVETKLVELPMGVKYLLAPWRVWRTFSEDKPDSWGTT
ncbi:head-tail connector protein [Xanthobacteraceae bacterium A53D]